jgi:putative transposase
MYLAGVSVRRVEDITEALWGARVSPSAVSNLNKKIYAKIEAWRNRPIEGEHPYVLLDGSVMKRTWAGEVRNVSLLVAIGVRRTSPAPSGRPASPAHEREVGVRGRPRLTSRAGAASVFAASPNTPEAPSRSCVRHCTIWLGCTSKSWASVLSP